MNNEQKQYILRKPVTILHELDYSLELNLGEYMMPVDKDCFKDEFVPLNVAGLTRQVEELLQNYGARFFADYEIDRVSHKTNIEAQEAGGRMESRARKEFAEQIVLLLLNQEGETKK